METITRYVRRNAATGKTEFRDALHKRGKFGWKPVTLRWIECVYDICGNDRNPGMCADLWEDTAAGRKAVVFQGAWQRYLPRTRPGARVPAWIFLDEYSPVDFDGDLVLKWMTKNFVTGTVLPEKAFIPRRPVHVPSTIDLPFIGRADGLAAFKLSRKDLTALNTQVMKAPEGFQTNDGILRFETVCRHRFDCDPHYIVFHEDQPWFVTGRYDLVLRAFWRYARNNWIYQAA